MDLGIFYWGLEMTKDLLTKSVTELAPLIENKQISPVEITKEMLDHAEQVEDKLNATMEFYREEAEAAAEKAEKEIADGNYRGIFHGIPLGIKDNIFMKNKKTTMSSKIHQDYISPY